FNEKEHDFDVQKPESKVILSPSSIAQSEDQDDKIVKEAKEKIPTVGQHTLNSTNTFGATGILNLAVRPTYGDASKFLDDLDMPGLEDIIYSNDEDVVGVEADFNNLEPSVLDEPRRVHQALKDPSWIKAMQEELLQFKMQKVWVLVDLPYRKRAIGTKWVYRNKKDEKGIVIRNKVRLVAQGHTHEEGIDYEEVFALVARIEAIRLFLAYASFMGFMVYQLDVKSDFLYGTIKEEVYVCQPQGKSASTPIDTKKPLLKDLDGEDVDVHTYRVFNSHMLYLLRVEMVLNSPCPYWVSKNWLVQNKMALGKDISNSLMADNLPKNFWNTVIVKQLADVTRLQALVDKKKVMIPEAVIRDVLRLDDAEGVDCLPNEEIFTGLARIGYEKPSIKLTFYKAFFSSQWKFLIHTILQSLSAKCTSWNEFSSAMASAIICLSIGRKFNFSKYIFDSLVKNVDNSFKFYMYPRFIQLIIQNQLGDLSTHITTYISPALTQKVFANMRRIGKGFSGVETPLFEGMLVVQENVVDGITDEQVQASAAVTTTPEDVTGAVEEDIQAQTISSSSPPPEDLLSTSHLYNTPPSSPQPQPQAPSQAADFPLSLLQTALDTCAAFATEGRHAEIQAEKQAEIYQIDMDHAAKVLSMHEEELTKVHEVVEVVTTAKLITKVVTAASAPVSAASTIIPAAKPNIPAITITAAPIKVAASSTRQRRGVVIRDPEKESSAKTSDETNSKDKGKGILVEEPKPMKKKQQVEIDEAYARKLHKELNQDIDWDVAIEHNSAGFKLDYFKGKSYDDIRQIFEARFNKNMEFLLKSKEKTKEEESRALESINETPAQKAAKRRRRRKGVISIDPEEESTPIKPAETKSKDKGKGIMIEEPKPMKKKDQKAAKRRKLNEEAKEVEDLKQHLEIVPDEDDDVYTEATPLAKKVPVVDYQVILVNNKPRYKIIRADGTQPLYASIITMLKNFDREDLETL
nr:copia protein [Tanacetum cinerariifolium]